MKRAKGLPTVCLAILLGLLAMPASAQVAEDERVLITDPKLLESMGFPFDARNVYMLATTGASAGETRDFGTTNTHYTPVAGSEFRGVTDDAGSWQYHAFNFSLSRVGTETVAQAQIHLPTGAVLTGVRWWAYDATGANLALLIFESCTPGFGPGFPTATLLKIADPATTGSGGEQSGFMAITPRTVDNLNCVYVAQVRFDSMALILRKIRAEWHRQISPAPATATFGDVPTGHAFFPFIEALVAAGITSGCNLSPPLYCPDNPVTRGQMAAFISRALGLSFP